MANRLKSFILGHPQDANKIGYRWRLMAAFGYGALFSTLIRLDEGITLGNQIMGPFGICLVIVGEMMTVRKQDELYKMRELTALSFAGIMSWIIIIVSLLNNVFDIRTTEGVQHLLMGGFIVGFLTRYSLTSFFVCLDNWGGDRS